MNGPFLTELKFGKNTESGEFFYDMHFHFHFNDLVNNDKNLK